MKFNIFYLLWPAALGLSVWLFQNFSAQSQQSFFATAETEPRILNLEHAAMAQMIWVKVGQEVKKGDTLAVFFRSDLGLKEAEMKAEINQYAAEITAKKAVLNQEEKLILAQKNVEIAKIDGDIQTLMAQEKALSVLKEAVHEGTNNNKNALIQSEIQALVQQKTEIEKAAQVALKQIAAQKGEIQTINQAKMAQSAANQRFIGDERLRLVVCAPIDGFIESVSVAPNELVPAFQPLFKINPKQPNRVIGFVHESVELPLKLGDSVWLASTARPQMLCAGRLVGTSPKLVELPLRLRKFAELRAWGHEVYIQIPDTNRFYIGEKLVVQLKQPIQ